MLYLSSQCLRCHHFMHFGQHIEISGKSIVYFYLWLKWIHIRIRKNYEDPTKSGSESTTLVETTYP
jgi:hypothetical protein